MAAALVVGLLVSACGSAEPYEEALGALELSDAWERTSRESLTHSDRDCSIMSGPSCPRVTDTYTVDLEAAEAYQQARDAINGLGMDISRERDDCRGQGSDCRVTGQADGRLVQVVIEVTDRPMTARATSHRAN
ncbi:hypothetical protein [Nitriliruptor alkaliphilus]|uniref:hypothetical protein n=1 Tax=Nitriliruptor alkaliphilus TaxID=427918 RepID=UPI0006972DE9|nr:hypothetical protein [Nitriliruptor alkaliphilus]